uniref:Uncharacterized protein n=1 Tax=Plectus sambesii TaxID=2011161 RepID=A0A914XIC5_9BILA
MAVFPMLLICLGLLSAAVAVEWTADGTGLTGHMDHWTTITRQTRAAGRGHCSAPCSKQLMLPCDFPSLDRCLMATCRELCSKDEQRKVNSCFCQTVGEVTMRACFCQPKKGQTTAQPKILRF